MSNIDMSAAHDLPPPKLEALIEMMFLAASADGDFSDVELGHFNASIESLTSGRVKGAELEELVTKLRTSLEKEGRESRLSSVKERLPDKAARKVALSLAVQVTAADGIIRTSERELILETAEALDIDRDEAADLVSKLAPR
jgi:tellurite resistance protein